VRHGTISGCRRLHSLRRGSQEEVVVRTGSAVAVGVELELATLKSRGIGTIASPAGPSPFPASP